MRLRQRRQLRARRRVIDQQRLPYLRPSRREGDGLEGDLLIRVEDGDGVEADGVVKAGEVRQRVVELKHEGGRAESPADPLDLCRCIER